MVAVCILLALCAGLGLGLHERPVALDLPEPHDEEARDDKDPVHVVRDDAAVGRRVVPAKDGIEEAPAAATVQLGTTALKGGTSSARVNIFVRTV